MSWYLHGSFVVLGGGVASPHVKSILPSPLKFEHRLLPIQVLIVYESYSMTHSNDQFNQYP